MAQMGPVGGVLAEDFPALLAGFGAGALVDDPHIIPVYEAGQADGVLFIAMRFVPGSDLRAVLAREGALEPGRVTEFISPVASALDAAHPHPRPRCQPGAGGRREPSRRGDPAPDETIDSPTIDVAASPATVDGHRESAPDRTAPVVEPHAEDRDQRRRGRGPLVGVAAAIAAAVIVGIVVLVLSGGKSPPGTAHSGCGTPPPASSPPY